MQQHYRQGDVMVVRVDGPIPDGATPVPSPGGKTILALGEATGHHHRIERSLATMYAWQGDELIEAREGAVILHEEHDPIPLPAGVYRLVHQREYAPGEIRRVVD